MTTDPHDLDDLFAAARAQAPTLGDDLRTRILADADAEQAARRVRRGWSLRTLRLGWALPSVAGAATALVAGFWIGVVLPDPVAALDMPFWLSDTFLIIDQMAAPILGLDDPFAMGF